MQYTGQLIGRVQQLDLKRRFYIFIQQYEFNFGVDDFIANFSKKVVPTYLNYIETSVCVIQTENLCEDLAIFFEMQFPFVNLQSNSENDKILASMSCVYTIEAFEFQEEPNE